MYREEKLAAVLLKYRDGFYPVVPFDPARDRLLAMDLTADNKEITADILTDTNRFSAFISGELRDKNCKYGIGGYAEHRTIYNRSKHFDSAVPGEEPRRLHLGVDIWGAVNTPVIAPLDGVVHSFAFNNNFGDYGATIILTHNIEGNTFHTLYGHLSLNSIKNISEGDLIRGNDVFGEFGMQFENGHWPPHLHLQLIIDMRNMKGDYPGVCRYSEKTEYLKNSPDPALLLNMLRPL